MRSLFVRIFLSYWVAQALFLVLAILVTMAIRPSGDIAGVQAQQAKFLNEAVQAYQDGGEEGARKYLRGVRDMSGYICLMSAARSCWGASRRSGSNESGGARRALPILSGVGSDRCNSCARPRLPRMGVATPW
jgi:hypothetical protein